MQDLHFASPLLVSLAPLCFRKLSVKRLSVSLSYGAGLSCKLAVFEFFSLVIGYALVESRAFSELPFLSASLVLSSNGYTLVLSSFLPPQCLFGLLENCHS